MNHPAPKPFNASEAEIAGHHVLASPEIPYVRIEAVKIGERATRFSVTSSREVGRDFISRVMTYPLQEIDDWKSVESGLRDVAYPTRTIKKLHQSTVARSRLSGLRSASVELADILKATKNTNELYEFLKAWRNQSSTYSSNFSALLKVLGSNEEDRDFEVPTVNEEYPANIPVFTNGEAIQFVENSLLASTPGIVAELARGHTDNPTTIRALDMLSNSDSQADMIPGLSEEEKGEIINTLIRDVDRRNWVEVIHELLDYQFVAVREEASFDGQTSKGGGYDGTVYVRYHDLPEHLHKYGGDIRILVGPRLRDTERDTNLPRHRVKFIRRKHITVAHPQVAWVNNQGKRHFIYPPNPNERSFLRPIIARPNSLVGAAIFANIVGITQIEIDYNRELNKLLGHRSKFAAPLARAGMLGLVLHAQQEELLSYPYFEMMEERALQ